MQPRHILVVAAAAGLLTACAGPQPSRPEGQAGTPAATEAAAQAGGEVKNPDTFVTVGLADPIESLDPAYIYDTGSGEVAWNIYDTLIFLDGEQPDAFKPWLATEVPTEENGLLKDDGKTYEFPIRTGVKFQYGPVKGADGADIPGSGELSPDDVAYSFHRGMLQDRAGGPQWMLLEPLLGVQSVMDLAKKIESESGGKAADAIETIDDVSPATLERVCQTVKDAVTVDGGKVVFKLQQPFAPFKQILVGTWGSILDKEWVAAEIKDEQGGVVKKAGWDGDCATWRAFYDPKAEDSELFKATNGTGPYKLGRWMREEEILLERNDGFWGERPAHLAKVIYKFNPEWSARLLMLQQGDADQVSIPRTNQDQVMPLVEQGILREFTGLPQSSMGFFSLNQKVEATDNAYIGSGQLDGQGIPPDFFSDPDVRKGFAYSFDWDTFIRDGLDNDAIQPNGPFISSVLGFDPDAPKYGLDRVKAEEHFRKAFGGKLWDTGFTLVLPATAGATNVQTAWQIFEKNLADLNPKFVVKIQEAQSTQLTQDTNNDLVPLEYSGWQEDYHDPHNWAFPLLGSQGYFARRLDFDPAVQAQLDKAIDAARLEQDPAKRAELYKLVTKLNHDNVLLLPRAEPLGHEFERAWIQGALKNPAYVGTYFWNLSKGAEAPQ
jgi:peptide/nickel transport system substrate-binding protein